VATSTRWSAGPRSPCHNPPGDAGRAHRAEADNARGAAVGAHIAASKAPAPPSPPAAPVRTTPAVQPRLPAPAQPVPKKPPQTASARATQLAKAKAAATAPAPPAPTTALAPARKRGRPAGQARPTTPSFWVAMRDWMVAHPGAKTIDELAAAAAELGVVKPGAKIRDVIHSVFGRMHETVAMREDGRYALIGGEAVIAAAPAAGVPPVGTAVAASATAAVPAPAVPTAPKRRRGRPASKAEPAAPSFWVAMRDWMVLHPGAKTVDDLAAAAAGLGLVKLGANQHNVIRGVLSQRRGTFTMLEDGRFALVGRAAVVVRELATGTPPTSSEAAASPAVPSPEPPLPEAQTTSLAGPTPAAPPAATPVVGGGEAEQASQAAAPPERIALGIATDILARLDQELKTGVATGTSSPRPPRTTGASPAVSWPMRLPARCPWTDLRWPRPGRHSWPTWPRARWPTATRATGR